MEKQIHYADLSKKGGLTEADKKVLQAGLEALEAS